MRTERTSTEHKRDSRGRIISLPKPPARKRVNYRYISVVSSIFALSIIALSVMLALVSGRNAVLANNLEAQYQRNFAEFAASMQSIENNLEAALGSEDAATSGPALDEIYAKSNMAIANLNALPVKSENKAETLLILGRAAGISRSFDDGEAQTLLEEVKGFRENFQYMENKIKNSYRIVDGINHPKRKQYDTDLDRAFSGKTVSAAGIFEGLRSVKPLYCEF